MGPKLQEHPPTEEESKPVWVGRRVQDAFSAVSIANLLYFRYWTTKFLAYGRQATWFRAPPRPTEYLALILAVLLVASVLYAFFRWLRAVQLRPKGLCRTVTMLAAVPMFVLPAGLLILNNPLMEISGRFAVIGGLAGAGLLGIAYISGRVAPLRALSFLLAVSSPTLFFTFGKSMINMAAYDPSVLRPRPAGARLAPSAPAPHVVWVIFDEWDEALSFLQRPASVRLPELDRLRASAFYSDAAYTPGPQTDMSMPALTTGKRVLKSEPNGPADEVLRVAGSNAPAHWSELPNVFSAARSLGFNTGVVGWFLPYCRILAPSLTGCEYLNGSEYFDDAGVPRLVWDSLRVLVEPNLRSPFGQTLAQQSHAWAFHRLEESAESAVLSQKYELTLLHLPVPHSPFFYKATTGSDDLGAKPSFVWSSGLTGYLDALSLVDSTVGRLRRAMEAAGVWDKTTLLFSADHYFRQRTRLDGNPIDPRVPFILKLAGQNESMRGETPFNALLTYDLLLALLKREVSTASDVNRWIEAHRNQFPLDWNAKQ